MTALLQYARELRVFHRFERNLVGHVAFRLQDGAAANNDRELKRAFQDMVQASQLAESETVRERARAAITEAKAKVGEVRP